jgi:GMP synthase (glutamine-hydrolysing)
LNGAPPDLGYNAITPTKAGREFLPALPHMTRVHSLTLKLGEGITQLAQGQACANRAFRFGEKVCGLPVHPECAADIFRRWPPWNRLMAQHDVAQGQWFDGFLRKTCLGTPANRHDEAEGGLIAAGQSM